MNNFLKKNKLQIYLAGSILALVLVFFFATFFMVKEISRKSDEIQKKNIDAEIIQNKLGKLPSQMESVALFEQSRNDLEAILSSDKEVDFIKGIEAIAEETGNGVVIKINEEGKNSQPVDGSILSKLPAKKYISVEMTLEGNYSQMLQFINKLENFQYYLTVVSINSKLVDETAQNNNSYFSESKVESGAKKFVRTTLGVVVYLNE